jgi:hypothetical protein
VPRIEIGVLGSALGGFFSFGRSNVSTLSCWGNMDCSMGIKKLCSHAGLIVRVLAVKDG